MNTTTKLASTKPEHNHSSVAQTHFLASAYPPACCKHISRHATKNAGPINDMVRCSRLYRDVGCYRGDSANSGETAAGRRIYNDFVISEA